MSSLDNSFTIALSSVIGKYSLKQPYCAAYQQEIVVKVSVSLETADHRLGRHTIS